MKSQTPLCSTLLGYSVVSASTHAASYSNSSIALSTSASNSIIPTISTSAQWPSASTSSIASNTSIPGNSSWSPAQSCNAELSSWSKHYYSTWLTTSLSMWTRSWTTYFPPTGATPYTTLCDGTPRAHGTASWGWTTLAPEPYNDTYYTSILITGAAAAPTCTIGSRECASLWESWTNHGTLGRLEPQCPETCVASLYTTDYIGQKLPPCYIKAHSVELAYWPVTVEGNQCGNGTTITKSAATPRTASIWDTTITDPGVIVSFDSIWVFDQCGSTIDVVYD